MLSSLIALTVIVGIVLWVRLSGEPFALPTTGAQEESNETKN